MEDGPSFSCGCGTEVTGLNQEQTLEVIKVHACSSVTEAIDAPVPWLSWVFSMWGWAIVATIGFVVLTSLHPELWDK
jgi:hypothetical protein